jgi:NIPSNAP
VKSVRKFLLQTVTLAFLAAILLGSMDTVSGADVNSEPRETPKIMDSETSRRAQTCCPIVELRQYTLHSGKRDTLIELFDREFVESQEALGMKIIGQFRDLNNPERFVWLRGFHDMHSRAEALKAFYGGPVWKAHGKAANATMIDSDNVLLLRPLSSERGIPVLPSVDPIKEEKGAQGIVVAQIFAVKPNRVDAFARQAEETFASYRAAGAREAGVLVTLDSPNNFPQLPVRTDGPYLVWLGIVNDNQTLDGAFTPLVKRSLQSLSRTGLLRGAPELVILDPTRRSRLRWLSEEQK